MYLKVTYEQEFDDLIMHLKSKYPQKLFDMDGIGEQTDMSKFSKRFFSSNTTSDASIDANANVDDISVIAYHSELAKPFYRLNSYYMLWKELKKNHNLEVANTIIESQLTGDIYINDFHGIAGALPYCYNYSTYDIMTKGLSMVKKVRCQPPKYLYAFKSQLEQFTVLASNSTLGACGLADILIVMSYYVKNILNTKTDAHFSFNNEEDCWKYIKENLVSFIYTINQPMRGNQSPFTNVSIYDRNFLEGLKDDYIFPDGTLFDMEIVEKLQDLFIKTMVEELRRSPITFPVQTACFSIDKEGNILDNKFLEKISNINKEFGQINIYCGDSATLSSCCFDGEQKILTKSSKGVELSTFKSLLEKHWELNRKNFTVYHNGSWCSAKTIKIPLNNKKMFKITTANNKEIFVTNDHIHLTDKGEKSTMQLGTEDYLAFNSRKLDSYPEKCKKLTYEQGYLLGLYLGDGSKYKRKDIESYEITFSLNETNIPDLEIIKKALLDWGIEKELHIHWQNNTMLTKLYSKELFDIISEYILGDYAYEKQLNMNILLQSIEFRNGICFGWYASDGGNANRIYTTSKELIPQAEALFNSIGINTVVDMSDRTGENEVIIREKSYNRNYPLYCIRWYDMKNKRSMKDIYKIINNTEYFKIKSIEEYKYNDEFVYCFEMKNEKEQYFTLPNGIITHNCRLRSDKTNEYFNSFGSGSSKIGSMGVVSINLPRLAFKHKNNKDSFFAELKRLVYVCGQINNAKRKLVQKRIDNGNHPLYSLGFININTQYSTVGINGFNECIEILGDNILDKSGQELGLKIIQSINEENDKCAIKFKTAHNCEQIPAENVSIKLAQKDKLLKYNDKYNIYSNQFIPLVTNADLLDRIFLQGLFDKHFSGGAIAHINVETPINDTNQLMDLIRTCAKMGVIYFAINYNLQECEKGHMSVGKKDICSICNSKIINDYTRVVGFLTNTKNWHEVRREEDYPNRIFYKGIL